MKFRFAEAGCGQSLAFPTERGTYSQLVVAQNQIFLAQLWVLLLPQHASTFF
jgi:hypothetical protein